MWEVDSLLVSLLGSPRVHSALVQDIKRALARGINILAQGTWEIEREATPNTERREEEGEGGGGSSSRRTSTASGRRREDPRRAGRMVQGRGEGAPPPLGRRGAPEDQAQVIVTNILNTHPVRGSPSVQAPSP